MMEDNNQTIQLLKAPAPCADWSANLWLLYYPMIGPRACQLYCLLQAIESAKPQVSWQQLEQLAGLSPAMIEQALVRLEQYGLLRSFVNEQGERKQLMLCWPKNWDALLSDVMLSRLLLKHAGDQTMDLLGQMMEEKLPDLNLQESTAHLSAAMLEERWDQSDEDKLRSFIREDTNEGYDFDWPLFYQGMQRAIPDLLRTKENQRKIVEIARVYGLSEEELRKRIIHYIPKTRHRIDFDGLIKELNASMKKAGRVQPDDYSAPPVSFLQARQRVEAIVTPEEKNQFRKLAAQGLSNEIINTLIEYVLQKNNGTISVAYLRTLGNNLIRQGVKNRQEALDALSRPFAGSQNRTSAPAAGRLPEWYDDKPQREASAQELEDVLKMMDEMFGESQS